MCTKDLPKTTHPSQNYRCRNPQRHCTFITHSEGLGVPEGNYADENMKQTVVPNRNMVLLSIAAAYAIGIKANHLFYGAHAGDHTIYPDCRPAFVSAMTTAFHLCDWSDIILDVPYLHMTKGDIVKRGMSLNVDYSMTWTCYKGGEKPCGKCGSCDERLAAFREAGIKDPVEYQ